MEVVGSLVGKVVDSLFGVAKKEISYAWNCSENVENLQKEAEKLSGMKGRVQQQIDLAKFKGELLLDGLEEWMKEADSKISDATEFINEEAQAKKTCFNLRFCVNLGTLRHYSKIATKKMHLLRIHEQDGESFETRVSLPAPTPRFVDLYQRKILENIETQESALKMIIEAIEDDTIQIVGIVGLGGVGKTTLASEAAAKMKNQFEDIVFIAVSQNVNAKMIQEKVQAAASKIIKGEKVLIILDDVWEELKLDELGIPCGSDYTNCKILLTSRSEDVCEAMNAQKNISVNLLQEEEAWTMFERAVGKSEWDDTLKQVALKIVKECGGLPLFVQAVGKALKSKDIKSWEAALGRLQDPTDEDARFKIKGIMQLKLSYDYLESEVLKSCFLLCSMFPEDEFIDLERLTYYGLGLGIFNNPNSNIQDAKQIVQLAVESLKSAFLLLPRRDNNGNEKITMHDLVRDMAILITSKGNDKFSVQSGTGLREWQPTKHLESYKKISLMRNEICVLPDHELFFPHLDAFLIQDNKLSVVPDEFFRGIKNLRVLDMAGNDISSLPQSLNQLTKLRTLDLSGNESLCQISVLGELTCLEILKLNDTGITHIPKEIGKLTKLRLLYVSQNISRVAPGVISKLIWLEEFYIGLSKEEESHEFLEELSELKSLKVLDLKVPLLQYIPEDFCFGNLIEFHIKDDYYQYPRNGEDCKRILQVSKGSLPFTKPVMKLIQLSEKLRLQRINNLYNILPDLNPEGFDELKYIDLWWCDNVRSLVMTSDLDAMQTSNELGPMGTKGQFFSKVEGIDLYSLCRLELLWDRPHKYINFCNLANIKISNCPSLLELFPLSVAQELVNLRDLYISLCESLVAVISAGDEQMAGSKTELVTQDTFIVFPLTRIRLRDLPKLECFYSGHSITQYPCLSGVVVKNCRNIKSWSYGDNQMPKLEIDQGINDYIEARNDEMGVNISFWESETAEIDEGAEDFIERFYKELLLESAKRVVGKSEMRRYTEKLHGR